MPIAVLEVYPILQKTFFYFKLFETKQQTVISSKNLESSKFSEKCNCHGKLHKTYQFKKGYILRSQILGSSEITKTNLVNLHGFCTDTFLK